MREDPHLRIVCYNVEYPKIFSEIKQFICNVIPYKVKVEHIGSTAVPRLGGRDIIDVLIVAKREHMEKIAELLESKGFKYNPQAGALREKLFVSGSYKYRNRELHIHIHVTFFGSKEHKDKLLFRDYLRRHADEAKKYYELKKRWMWEANLNRSKYGELKTAYINKILRKARKEKKGKINKFYSN
jgi:GrpB-like predicted nucleotidyltransferase (UPF0157 family)